MYVQHFGLKSRPFRTSATGPDVFVGPQTAKTMAGLKKALDVPDAVVTVTGPVGVGKTTLVYRALNALGDSRVIISVGRMHLADDEVLELLLDELGTRQTPNGTVQRFSLFRRLLKGFSDKGTRVFIVVEDAARIGSEALSELEALTAADAGVSDGANIILMGEPGMNAFLKTPPLARLKQRIRLRESIAALSSGELRAYLKHSFRNAGGDFDSVFADDTVELLHRHSGGIPRVVNNTVEMILGSAAEQTLDKVTPEFITSVVTDECGMTAQVQVLTVDAAVSKEPIVEAVAEQEPAPVVAAEAPSVDAKSANEESTEKPQPKGPVADLAEHDEEPAAVPVEAASVEEAPVNDEPASDEYPIPDLIQDTLPNLTILSPEIASTPAQDAAEPRTAAAIKAEPPAISIPLPATSDIEPSSAPGIGSDTPELVFEDDVIDAPAEETPGDDIPTLFSSTPLTHPIVGDSADDTPPVRAEPEAEPVVAAQPVAIPEPQPAVVADESEIPEWDRDPTLAELRPDLDALERAMSYTLSDSAHNDSESDDRPEELLDVITKDVVPEITLDRAIQDKIDEATELLKKTTIDLAEVTAAEEARVEAAKAVPKKPAATKPAAKKPATTTPKTKADAANNAELQKISSELAKAKTIEDVDDRMAETLFGEEFSQIAAQVAAHAAANVPLPDESANDNLQLAAKPGDRGTDTPKTNDAKSSAMAKSKPVVRPNIGNPDDNISATQRLRTVRELNGNFDPVPEPGESVVLSSDKSTSPSPLSSAQPESIEDQINTSMTQTLKALNVRPPPTISDDDDDDDDDESKGGFFNRFRRS